MRHSTADILSTTAAVLITLSISVYIFVGAAIPRPLWIFGTIGVSSALVIAAAVLIDPRDQNSFIRLLLAGLLTSAVSR